MSTLSWSSFNTNKTENSHDKNIYATSNSNDKSSSGYHGIDYDLDSQKTQLNYDGGSTLTKNNSNSNTNYSNKTSKKNKLTLYKNSSFNHGLKLSSKYVESSLNTNNNRNDIMSKLKDECTLNKSSFVQRSRCISPKLANILMKNYKKIFVK